LAEHLFNLSEDHQRIANQVIKYLYLSQYLAIEFNDSAVDSAINSDSFDLQIASDAAFADD
jgi:hypothetical protein